MFSSTRTKRLNKDGVFRGRDDRKSFTRRSEKKKDKVILASRQAKGTQKD